MPSSRAVIGAHGTEGAQRHRLAFLLFDPILESQLSSKLRVLAGMQLEV